MQKRLRSILIVDDHEPDIMFSRIVIDESGLVEHVMTSQSGIEALRLFVEYEESRLAHPDAFPPAVILLDINMPGLDGFEFLEKYEATIVPKMEEVGMEQSVVLMISSSDGMYERKRAAKFKSVKDFIRKPLSAEAVEGLVERFGTDG